MERQRYRAVRSPLRRGASMIYGLNRYENSPILPLLSPLSDRENLRKILKINRYEIGFRGFLPELD